jgi:hypothetical protein
LSTLLRGSPARAQRIPGGQKWKGLLSSVPLSLRSSGSSSLSSAGLSLSRGGLPWSEIPTSSRPLARHPRPVRSSSLPRVISRRFHAACFNERDEGAAPTRLTARQKARGYFRELRRFPRAGRERRGGGRGGGGGGGSRLLDGKQTMKESRPRLVSKRDGMHSTAAQLARARLHRGAPSRKRLTPRRERKRKAQSKRDRRRGREREGREGGRER